MVKIPYRAGIEFSIHKTIFSDSSMQGDALATAAFVLGTEEGLKLIESLEGTEAVFIARDRTVTYSSGAEDYMIK